ncbi:MAG: glycosyltransferase family 4 protein, partial [Lachnospiraceae bacterium]|nr:glycosyltransferase family 4 protein [Lachnospiraceae bacterium]
MSEKQRIAVVSQCFWPEPFRINDICAEWVKRGYEVTAITAIPNYPQGDFYPGYGWTKRRQELHDGIRILHLPMTPRKQNKICLILNYISFLISGLIWARTTRRRFERVFIFETSPMTQALIGTTLAKRLHIPCDLYVQDLWPDNVEVVAGVKNRRVLSAISRMCDRIYRDSTQILVTSPSFVETLAERGVPREKLLYWPQYAEDFYRPHRGVWTGDSKTEGMPSVAGPAEPVSGERETKERRIPDDDAVNIIFTGNIGAAQGLEILPQAAKLLKNRKTARPVRFVVVGDGRARESFEMELQRQKVEDRFVMIPRQPAEEIPKLLGYCDAAFLSFMDT